MKSNATMKSVKEVRCLGTHTGASRELLLISGTSEALVAHLGKPELLRSCRLVQPVGENGAFSSFKAKSGAVRILVTFCILAGQREAEWSPCLAGAGNPQLAAPPSSSMVSYGALALTCFRGQQAKSQPKMCLRRRACRR